VSSNKYLVVGGWPALKDMEEEKAKIFNDSYITVVIERDINSVDSVKRDSKRMLGLLKSIARNIGTCLKISTLQNDVFAHDENINITGPTIIDYLNVLSKLNLYLEIPA
jgi:predicted AAA+ superfamily ATPase